MFLIRFWMISPKINFFWILVNTCWLNYPHVALIKIPFLVTKTLQNLIGLSIWLSACIWGLKNVHLHLIHRSYTGILIKLILTISFESWILVIFHILAKIYIFDWVANTNEVNIQFLVTKAFQKLMDPSIWLWTSRIWKTFTYT